MTVIDTTQPPGGPNPPVTERIPVLDSDVHQNLGVGDEQLLKHLPERWQQYLRTYGIRHYSTEKGIPPQREFTHRLDSIDPSGRPTFLPDFTRQQLLDEYDMSAVILSNGAGINLPRGGGNFPEQLAIELASAFNDAHREIWLEADPRFYASIHLPYEHPEAAVKEIQRVKDGPLGDRFPSVVLEPRAEFGIGNPKYWPIYEACQHYDLPITFHTSPGRRMTPSGGINYYFEWHCGIGARNFPVSSSFIFEGVFEQFPQLRVALIEQSWAWAAPFVWRLDESWNALKAEVPHLKRAPSEYFREHFYFTTQPMEEPESFEEFPVLLQQFEDTIGPDHLMFSSDYPHWDFDSPYESVPQSLPIEQRRRILGENGSKFYNIPLKAGSGIVADPNTWNAA